MQLAITSNPVQVAQKPSAAIFLAKKGQNIVLLVDKIELQGLKKSSFFKIYRFWPYFLTDKTKKRRLTDFLACGVTVSTPG